MDESIQSGGTSTVLTITGKRNLCQHAKSEDVVFVRKSEPLWFFGIADGQSGKKHCREGGKEALNAIYSIISEITLPALFQHQHIDELQYLFMKEIRDRIEKVAQRDAAEKTDYASTIVVVAIDPVSEQYMIVHLGDGCIIGRKRSGEISMLSAPENGLTLDYTWLTTSEDAMLHLRIGFGKANAYDRVLLITDGAFAIARGKNISERSKRILLQGSTEDIFQLVKKSDPEDDAAILVIELARGPGSSDGQPPYTDSSQPPEQARNLP